MLQLFLLFIFVTDAYCLELFYAALMTNDKWLIASEVGTRPDLMDTCLSVLSIYFNDNVCIAI